MPLCPFEVLVTEKKRERFLKNLVLAEHGKIRL